MKSKRFLLIDNNSIALRELSDLLKYIGFTDIHETTSTNDAWAILRVKEFDCIISAWDMPDMSGIALLKISKNDDKLYKLPFFLTDSAFTKLKVIQAGQSGATGLMVSPYNVDNIKAKMDSLSEGAFSQEPSKEEKNLDAGLRLIEKGKHEKALTVFEDLVTKGESAEYYYNIGYIKTVQEKYSESIEAFQRATQLDRLFAKAFEAMGRAYKELGKEDEAEKYLRKAADIYMSKNNDQDAEDILNEILEIKPDTINVYNSLGVLYRRKGDLKTSLSHYEKALKVHPDEPHILYNIGRLYLDMKFPEDAKHYFSLAIKSDPSFKEAEEVLKALELGTV